MKKINKDNDLRDIFSIKELKEFKKYNNNINKHINYEDFLYNHYGSNNTYDKICDTIKIRLEKENRKY